MAPTRRMWIGGACCLLLAGVALAQRPGGPGGDPKQMIERQVAEMKKRLKLTADQETKITSILTESAKKTVALRQKYGPSGEDQDRAREMMAEMRKIREDSRAEIGKVLTSEQMKEYDKLEQERRERFGGGKRGPGQQR